MLAALFQWVRGSVLVKGLYSGLSMTGISTPLYNGSVELSGKSQTTVHGWYLSTAKQWFRGAIRKLTDGCA
jgi:hypothetical protein